MRIILASQSPRRRELLERMGIRDFEVLPARGEELADPSLPPAELVEELPQISRVAGTGMSSAQTGAYRCAEWGGFTCCIDPRMGPWLLVTGTDGSVYLFGSSAQGGAEAALAALG